MALPATPATVDVRDFYPLHEEDDALGESPAHDDQTRYLVGALRVRHPEWFVTRNLCVYREPGNDPRYRAPDLLVVRATVKESWEPPNLAAPCPMEEGRARGNRSLRALPELNRPGVVRLAWGGRSGYPRP